MAPERERLSATSRGPRRKISRGGSIFDRSLGAAMELRELAERVLFSSSLEEKLHCVEEVTDERPGPGISLPHAPGRPSELHFKPNVPGKSEFPGIRQLDRERERGRLLHFFANHELLATELMALVLLRFPDAPTSFRRGVFNTLKDEQRHTRLYIRRMAQCGVEFGQFPVNGFFWRVVSPMESPMDYVSALCLTFEQANLDHAGHFARGFDTVGDQATAKLLNRIYHDEIGHVAYGLKWFRHWKNPNESDWEAFCRQLKFPLSPQRAKGLTLNVAGRRAAGLDAEFIAQLDVYSQSKGRTPNVFVFNPFTEGYLSEGMGFNPGRAQAELASDLANLPQFLCRQDDIVLVPQRPGVAFLSSIKQAGFTLPEFVEMEEGRIKPGSRLARRRLGQLRPWAWGPDSVELLKPLFQSVTAEAREDSQRFNKQTRQLYSKAWSANLLGRILADRQAAPWLCPHEVVGQIVGSVEEALGTIQSLADSGHEKIVVKKAFGVAGQNMLRTWEMTSAPARERWLANALGTGTELVVEPWLDREIDFSVQLEMQPSGLKLRGYTGLVNDRRGGFRANWAESHHHQRIPARVIACFDDPPDIARRMLALYADVCSALEGELRRAEYLGPLGLDAFVYRGNDGSRRLKPIVEINPRHTMGRVCVELMKQASPGRAGAFTILSRARIKSMGFAGLAHLARVLTERFPPRTSGHPVARIDRGCVCLNDPAVAKNWLAVFRVGCSVEAVETVIPVMQAS